MQAAVKLKIQNLNPQNAGEAARKGAALVVEKKMFYCRRGEFTPAYEV